MNPVAYVRSGSCCMWLLVAAVVISCGTTFAAADKSVQPLPCGGTRTLTERNATTKNMTWVLLDCHVNTTVVVTTAGCAGATPTSPPRPCVIGTINGFEVLLANSSNVWLHVHQIKLLNATIVMRNISYHAPLAGGAPYFGHALLIEDIVANAGTSISLTHIDASRNATNFSVGLVRIITSTLSNASVHIAESQTRVSRVTVSKIDPCGVCIVQSLVENNTSIVLLAVDIVMWDGPFYISDCVVNRSSLLVDGLVAVSDNISAFNIRLLRLESAVLAASTLLVRNSLLRSNGIGDAFKFIGMTIVQTTVVVENVSGTTIAGSGFAVFRCAVDDGVSVSVRNSLFESNRGLSAFIVSNSVVGGFGRAVLLGLHRVTLLSVASDAWRLTGSSFVNTSIYVGEASVLRSTSRDGFSVDANNLTDSQIRIDTNVTVVFGRSGVTFRRNRLLSSRVTISNTIIESQVASSEGIVVLMSLLSRSAFVVEQTNVSTNRLGVHFEAVTLQDVSAVLLRRVTSKTLMLALGFYYCNITDASACDVQQSVLTGSTAVVMVGCMVDGRSRVAAAEIVVNGGQVSVYVYDCKFQNGSSFELSGSGMFGNSGVQLLHGMLNSSSVSVRGCYGTALVNSFIALQSVTVVNSSVSIQHVAVEFAAIAGVAFMTCFVDSATSVIIRNTTLRAAAVGLLVAFSTFPSLTLLDVAVDADGDGVNVEQVAMAEPKDMFHTKTGNSSSVGYDYDIGIFNSTIVGRNRSVAVRGVNATRRLSLSRLLYLSGTNLSGPVTLFDSVIQQPTAGGAVAFVAIAEMVRCRLMLKETASQSATPVVDVVGVMLPAHCVATVVMHSSSLLLLRDNGQVTSSSFVLDSGTTATERRSSFVRVANVSAAHWQQNTSKDWGALDDTQIKVVFTNTECLVMLSAAKGEATPAPQYASTCSNISVVISVTLESLAVQHVVVEATHLGVKSFEGSPLAFVEAHSVQAVTMKVVATQSSWVSTHEEVGTAANNCGANDSISRVSAFVALTQSTGHHVSVVLEQCVVVATAAASCCLYHHRAIAVVAAVNIALVSSLSFTVVDFPLTVHVDACEFSGFLGMLHRSATLPGAVIPSVSVTVLCSRWVHSPFVPRYVVHDEPAGNLSLTVGEYSRVDPTGLMCFASASASKTISSRTLTATRDASHTSTQSESDQTSLTASLLQVPPIPDVSKWKGAASVGTVVVGTVSALTGQLSTVGDMQRTMLLMQLTECELVQRDERLPFADSPTQFGFGPRANYYVRGAVVGNIGFVVGGVAVATALVAVGMNCLSRSDDNCGGFAARWAATTRMPGVLVVPLLLVLQPTVSYGLALVMVPVDSGASAGSGGAPDASDASSREGGGTDSLIGLVGLAAVSGLALLFVWRVSGVASALSRASCGNASTAAVDPFVEWIECRRTEPPRRAQGVGCSAVAGVVHRLRLLMSPAFEWRPRRESSNAGRLYLQQYGYVLEEFRYRRQWFFVVEMAAGIVVGGIGGVRPETNAACQASIACILAVSVVLCGLNVWLQPRCSTFGNCNATLGAAISIVAAMLLLLSSGTDTTDAIATFFLTINLVSTFAGSIDVVLRTVSRAVSSRTRSVANLKINPFLVDMELHPSERFGHIKRRSAAGSRGGRLMPRLRESAAPPPPPLGDCSDDAFPLLHSDPFLSSCQGLYIDEARRGSESQDSKKTVENDDALVGASSLMSLQSEEDIGDVPKRKNVNASIASATAAAEVVIQLAAHLSYDEDDDDDNARGGRAAVHSILECLLVHLKGLSDEEDHLKRKQFAIGDSTTSDGYHSRQSTGFPEATARDAEKEAGDMRKAAATESHEAQPPPVQQQDATSSHHQDATASLGTSCNKTLESHVPPAVQDTNTHHRRPTLFDLPHDNDSANNNTTLTCCTPPVSPLHLRRRLGELVRCAIEQKRSLCAQ